MKKLAVYVLLGFCLSLFPKETFGFRDISDYPYKEAIEYLENAGVVGGFSDGSYKPYQSVTRAEMMKIILKGKFDEKDLKYIDCFSDVKTDWFSPFVCFGKEKNVVSGYSDGTFKPNNNVNFAEALKIAFLGLEVSGDFSSSSEDWFSPYVDFADKNMIFLKYLYLPQDNITRGQMAEIVYRIGQYKQGKLKENIDDRKSFGCGIKPPSTKPVSIKLNGTERNFITVIPDNYIQTQKYPIIFAIHGRTNTNSYLRTYLGVEEAAQGKAFIIYPDGRQPGGVWKDQNDKNDKIRDFALFDRLVIEFGNKYCIDLDRVYVVGYSLGAWFTNSLSCVRGDIIRAIGTIGGGTTKNTCRGTVNALTMHNPKDNLSLYGEALMNIDQKISQNKCSTEKMPVEPAKFNCESYLSCSPDGEFIFCPHNIDNAWWDNSYYPHVWPKDAGKYVWEFLKKFD